MANVTVNVGGLDQVKPEHVAPAEPVTTKAPLPAGWFSFTAKKDDGTPVEVVASPKLMFREERRLLAELPGAIQANPGLMDWFSIMANIRRIDGDVVPMPTTPAELDILEDRIGQDGVGQLKMRRLMLIHQANEDLQAAIADVKARAKNSPGTPPSAKR